MAKKITALQQATETGLPIGRSGLQKLIYILCMVGGLVGLIYGGWQLVAHNMYSHGSDRVESGAGQLADRLTETLRAYRQQVAALGELPAVLQALRDPNEITLSAAENEVRKHVSDAIRVRVLTPGVERLEPQPFPGLGYASLALLLQSKNLDAVVGPGVGLARTQNAHLSWATPVMDGEELAGLVLVSFPMSIVGRALDSADIGSGYLDFRTHVSGGTTLIAISRGTASGELTEDLPTFEVAESSFEIGYFQTRPLLYSQQPGVFAYVLVAFCLMLVVAAYLFQHRPDILEKIAQPKEEEGAEEDTEVTLAELAAADEDLKEAMQFTEDMPAEAAAADAGGSTVPAEIFRAYDIRGVVGKALTSPVATMIGKAIGSEAIDRGVQQIVVARDGRLSGPDLVTALVQGLCSTGVDVVDIGAVPTGVLYFATHHLGTGSGVMVTGSHNPPDYNGFKIMLAGETLAAENIQGLHHRIQDGRLHEGSGGVQEMDVLQEFVDRIASDVQVEEPLKVVVDCGNGIAGRVAPLVLEEIGCEVVPLYCEVDGTFPNHHPDPSVPENLQDLKVSIEKLNADIGVALDGDGDRLGVVTRTGNIIYPDRLLMLFARDVLTRNPGAAVIYDVKCTGELARVVLQHGGSPIMWKTGHSLIKAKMKESQAALAGEMSGHFFFQERWYGFDCGIYAAARLLEVLAAEGVSASETLDALPESVSTPEIKVEMAEGEHYKFLAQFEKKVSFEGARMTTIDGVRADYEDGWGLVRCSNTTPCLVMRFDAETQEALDRIQAAFKEQLLSVRPDLALPF